MISDNLELFTDSQFSDNQTNKSAFVGCLIIYVDYTDKFSNFFEDLLKLDRFAQSVEDELNRIVAKEEESREAP